MEKHLKNSELYEERYGYKEERATVRFYVIFLLFVILLLSFRAYFVNSYGGVEVDGASMYTTLEHKDKLLMRYVEDGEGLERGDVIVVDVSDYHECRNIKDGFLIKRLIAVEGDRVKCTAGQISIMYAGESSWTPLEETVDNLGYQPYYSDKISYNFEEYVVGDGEIFFLGDNRNNSCDSRFKDKSGVGSHLTNSLYKAEDVYGIVPDWAIEHRGFLEKIFFRE